PRRVDVRDVGERLVPQAALVEDAAAGLRVELAVQSSGEGELLLVREGLVAEDEDGVLVHPRPDLAGRGRVVNPAQVHRAHLGDEVWMELPEAQRHVLDLLTPVRTGAYGGFPRSVNRASGGEVVRRTSPSPRRVASAPRGGRPPRACRRAT